MARTERPIPEIAYGGNQFSAQVRIDIRGHSPVCQPVFPLRLPANDYGRAQEQFELWQQPIHVWKPEQDRSPLGQNHHRVAVPNDIQLRERIAHRVRSPDTFAVVSDQWRVQNSQ